MTSPSMGEQDAERRPGDPTGALDDGTRADATGAAKPAGATQASDVALAGAEPNQPESAADASERDATEAGRTAPAVFSILGELAGDRLSQVWLLGLLVIVALAFFWMVRFFVTPVIVAAVFAGLAYPMQQSLARRLGGHRGLASLISCLILVAGILIPFYITANMVVVEAISFYEAARPEVDAAMARSGEWLAQAERWREALPTPLAEALPSDPLAGFDWAASVQNAAGTAGNVLANLINRTSRGTAQLVFGLFVVLFSMYYFFRDGERMIERLRYLSPLDAYYEDLLVRRLVSVSRATLRGSLILGFVQGGIGALTLALFGVPAALLWGVAMVVLSVIPLVGTWLIMYPIALLQLAQGRWIAALVIGLVTAVLISNIDNVLRPRLVGRGAGMHDLLVFFATLGGIGVYGVMGFIVGPIIAAFFVALLDIYALEYQPQLERPPRERDAAGALQALQRPADDPQARDAGDVWTR